MVIARFLINAGKSIVLEKVVEKLAGAYERFRSNKNQHLEKIGVYNLQDTPHFKGGPLEKVAEEHGLDGMLKNYQESLFQRINGYLAEIKEITSYIHQVAQSKLPADEVNLYHRLNRAYYLMSNLLGQKAYAPKPHAYLSDVVNDYMQKIGDLNKGLDRLLSAASGFNPDGSSFLGAASRRAAKFLSYQILKKEGIPTSALESILQPTAKFAELRKEAKPLFAEYRDAVKNLKTAYSGDLDAYAYAVA